MKWKKYTIETTTAAEDYMSSMLMELGIEGIEIEDNIPLTKEDQAEMFIDFLCNPEISGANMDYICYASPISAAKEHMEEYLAESEVVYPDEEVLQKGTSYAFLSEEISRYVEGLYQSATKTAVNTEDQTSNDGWILLSVAALAVVGAAYFMLHKRKRT